MTLTRTLTCSIGATVTALGFSLPAHADPPLLNGVYQGADDQFAWTIATGCDPAGCTGTASSNQGWTSPITLIGGRWDFTVVKPDGAICADGRYAPAVIRVSIDPASLGGVVTNDSGGQCPGEHPVVRPFQLHQIG